MRHDQEHYVEEIAIVRDDVGLRVRGIGVARNQRFA
jgi:hypothetical protein